MGTVYMLGFVVVQSLREMRSIDPWGNPSEPLHLGACPASRDKVTTEDSNSKPGGAADAA